MSDKVMENIIAIDKAQKVAVFKDIITFNKCFEKIDQERNSLISQWVAAFGIEYEILQEYEKMTCKGREMAGQQSFQDLLKIKKKVHLLEGRLKMRRNNPNSFKILKAQIEQIEDAMNSFKSKGQRYFKQLLEEENIFNEVLSVLEQRYTTWNRKLGIIRDKPAQKVVSKYTQNLLKSLPPATSNFETFLLTSGAFGGWDAFEHDNFISVWNKISIKNNIVSSILSYFPTKTKEEIANHISWYQTYLQLQEEKKIEIQAWRKSKKLPLLNHSQTNNEVKLDSEDIIINRKRIQEKDNVQQEILIELKDVQDTKRSRGKELKQCDDKKDREEMEKPRKKQDTKKCWHSQSSPDFVPVDIFPRFNLGFDLLSPPVIPRRHSTMTAFPKVNKLCSASPRNPKSTWFFNQ